MKFLADQDVYSATVTVLRRLGHDVETAADRGLSAASDETLLQVAHADGRIFVTRDRDFGALVFARQTAGGVIYLRFTPSALRMPFTKNLNVYSNFTMKQSCPQHSS